MIQYDLKWHILGLDLICNWNIEYAHVDVILYFKKIDKVQ